MLGVCRAATLRNSRYRPSSSSSARTARAAKHSAAPRIVSDRAVPDSCARRNPNRPHDESRLKISSTATRHCRCACRAMLNGRHRLSARLPVRPLLRHSDVATSVDCAPPAKHAALPRQNAPSHEPEITIATCSHLTPRRSGLVQLDVSRTDAFTVTPKWPRPLVCRPGNAQSWADD